MKKLFLLSITILFFTTCKKDTDMHTTVKGRVLEYGTLKPVSGADVFLTGKNVNCFSCGYNIIAPYKTDADGYFSFEFAASEGITYDLDVDKVRYFAKPNANVNITKGKMNDNRTITLYPEAYQIIYVKNVQPYDQNDLIGITGDWNCCASVPYYGTQVNTTVKDFAGRETLKVRGNMSNQITWFVTKNGI